MFWKYVYYIINLKKVCYLNKNLSSPASSLHMLKIYSKNVYKLPQNYPVMESQRYITKIYGPLRRSKLSQHLLRNNISLQNRYRYMFAIV